MRATFKLLNSYFWKTVYGPIIAFVFPAILLAILGSIFETKYVFPGIIAMTVLFIACLSLPLAIMELRGSSLFKYIGSSPVNPKKFAIVTVGFYVLIIFGAVIILFLFSTVFFRTQIFTGKHYMYRISPNNLYPNPVSGIDITGEGWDEFVKTKWGFEPGSSEAREIKNAYNFGDIYYDIERVNISNSIFSNLATAAGLFQFLFSLILHIIFSIFVGLAIATFSKTPQQALTISIILIIPSIFLSGMVVSVDIIASSTIMQWVSRLMPFRYTTGNLIESSAPLNELDLYMTFDQVMVLNGKSGEVMRRLILDNQYPLIASSSSGIFDYTSSYSVRRIPSISQIREFMISYLSGGEDGAIDPGSDRFLKLWEDIQAGKWGWLDLFLNQNNILYTRAEKVLNTIGPLIASGGLGVYVVKNFKWSTR